MDNPDKMTAARWNSLTPTERDALRAPAYPAQLAPYLGFRVEVIDHHGETRRFIVGMSTGWQPCYLELHSRRSTGGIAADSRGYASVRPLYRVR